VRWLRRDTELRDQHVENKVMESDQIGWNQNQSDESERDIRLLINAHALVIEFLVYLQCPLLSPESSPRSSSGSWFCSISSVSNFTLIVIVHASTGEPCGFCTLSVNSSTANPITVSHRYKSDALPGDAKVP